MASTALAPASDLHSEDLDTDSIMTDEIDEHAQPQSAAQRMHHDTLSGTIDPAALSLEHPAVPVASTSGTSSKHAGGESATKATLNSRPSGPVCEFGDRLGYTYFSKPVPTAESLNVAHKNTETYWLTIDNDLTYLSFFRDTGPLNVACLYRFCLHLHDLLENPALRSKRIILYSADDADKKANAALLMALYAMVVLRWSAADALHPVACLELQPFRDAGYARADFHLSLQDVLFGTRKAIDYRLLKLDEFNLQEYEYYEKVENGDWNYITPHFLAFASPMEPGYDGSSAVVAPAAGQPGSPKGKGKSGSPASSPRSKPNKAFRNVLDYFDKNGVKMVVRLNKKLYDEQRFTERGMEHREMYFDDGTNPTMEMVRDFIDLSERVIRAGGVVAIHCKAGLGRTGTLIGAYLIYKYGFSATEVIGFMRLMRPGTCVGPQQHYMYENQMTWIKWGAIDRYKAENPVPSALLLDTERPITPPTDDEKDSVTTVKEGSLAVHAAPSVASRLSTPRAVTPLLTSNPLTVPGQPRKTPGAKTRHAVAAPETVDVLHDDVFVDQMETQAAQNRLARASRDRESRERTGSISVASLSGSHRSGAGVTLPPTLPVNSPGSVAGSVRRAVSSTPSAAEKDEDMQLDEEHDSSFLSMRDGHRGRPEVAGLQLVDAGDVKPSKEQLERTSGGPLAALEPLRELTPATSNDGNAGPLSASPASGVNSTHNGSASAGSLQKTSKTPASASRIGKPRSPARPLATSATLDYNDENTNHAAAQPGVLSSRSRGRSASGNVSVVVNTSHVGKAKRGNASLLDAVYEDLPHDARSGNISSSSSSSGERYNLRAARSKEALSTSFLSHAAAANGRVGAPTPTPPPSVQQAGVLPRNTRSGQPQHVSMSPSRLPQRVAGRRRAAVASAAKTAGHLGVPTNSLDNGQNAASSARSAHALAIAAAVSTTSAPVSTRVGRMTRRRRSVEESN